MPKSSTSTRIRLLTLDDIDEAAEHVGRHVAENGTPGDPLFAPYGESAPFDIESFRTTRRERWVNPCDGVNFERMWGAYVDTDGGERLVGHADLRRTGLQSEIHRVWLGMGLERPARGKGIGRALLDVAIAWAKTIDGLDWIDLGVFEQNAPAIALYKSAGFIENGRVEDRFRVDNHRITDVQMALRLD